MLNRKINGWLIIDKPEGISSANAINKLKRFVKPNKIGHTGTLDPFASGIIIAAIGEATKLIDHVMNQEKIYEFSVKWGENTDTLDLTGVVIESSDKIPTLEAIEACLESFKKNSLIKQRPPKYSAIHINGRRAYEMARAGEDFIIDEREVFLKSVRLIKHEETKTTFEVCCGKGFYIRSFAYDIACKLESCGHVIYLKRINVGKFTQFDSIKLDYLLQLLHNAEEPEMLFDFLKPMNAMLDDILVLRVDKKGIEALRQGKKIQIENFKCQNHERIIACDLAGGDVVAICDILNSELIPKRVINN